MTTSSFSESRLVTYAAIACLITALLWVPWYQRSLSSSTRTFLGYGLLWSPAHRTMAGVSIDWTRVGAALAATAMVWAIMQMVLEPSSAANKS